MARPGTEVLAAEDRAPPGDPGAAARLDAATRAGGGARGRPRPGPVHALGCRRQLAAGVGEARELGYEAVEWHTGVVGCGRRRGPGRPRHRPDAHSAAGRNPGRTDDEPELDAGVQ